MVELCNLVTYDALQVARTVRELSRWIEAVEKDFIVTEKGRAYLRLKSGPLKTFREEVWPVEQFLTRLGTDGDLLVRFPCDDGPCDAEVFEPDGKQLFALLQVVNALDGQDDRLRRGLLTNAGHAPAFGPIRRDKATRSVVAEPAAVPADDTLRNVSALIDGAIKAKIAKPYPSHTWLLISFFDSILRPESLPQVITTARSSAAVARFERIYLVGQSQEHRLLARIDSAA